MSTAVIIIVIVVILGLIIRFWLYLGTQSGATIYSAQVMAALENGKSPNQAVHEGLNLLMYRKPFSELSDEDQLFLTELFSKLGHPLMLCPFLVNADKKHTAEQLKNRELMIKLVKTEVQNKQSQLLR